VILEPEQTHARCSDCEEELPIERFTVNNRRSHPDGRCRYNQCKSCRWDRHEPRRTANYHQAKEDNPRVWFYNNLRVRFKLTSAQVDDLVIQSSGLCAVCMKPFKNSKKEPHLDHNHKTDAVREFLCSRCNTMLGLIEDIKLLKRGISYLKHHRKP